MALFQEGDRAMLTTIEGIYRQGKIELLEVPLGVGDRDRVIVTFLGAKDVDLRERGIDAEQAAEARARLATFADDWNRVEMDVYDDYENAQIRTR
jgi:hypothetical protein